MSPLSEDHQGIVIVDGNRVEPRDAVIPADDLGLVRGDGVFDVFRVYLGVPFALDEHLDRLARSAAALQLDYDATKLEQEVLSLLGTMGTKDGHVRIILTRSGTRLLFEEPPLEFPSRYRLMLVPHLVTPLMSGVKSLSYGANCHARRLAEGAGYDDALLYSPHDGQVLECPFTSFAWVKDKRVFTPPLSAGILDSITRRVLLEATGTEEKMCTQTDLAAADEALIMGTGMEIVPVAEIANVRTFPEETPFVAEVACAVGDRIRARLREAKLSGAYTGEST